MSYKCRNTPLPVLRLYKITVAHYKITKNTHEATDLCYHKQETEKQHRQERKLQCMRVQPTATTEKRQQLQK